MIPDSKEIIHVDNAKYSVVLENKDNQQLFYALRYGEGPWRDLTGDKFVLALFHRIQELEKQLLDETRKFQNADASCDASEDNFETAEQALLSIYNTISEDKVTLGMFNHVHKVAFAALDKLGSLPKHLQGPTT